ncbi:MAG: T9SS type A sorting domain-containing protein [Ignavibacteria bacterium]|nr:T9SS type A sorting domain-containing protein [Ignavibacteria bacterium]
MKILLLLFTFCLLTSLQSRAQYPNILITSTGSPNEPAICMNPKNPNQIVAGSNLNFYYYSTNGGYNWTRATLTSTYSVWGDPAIAVDTNGHFYYGHLTNPSGSYFIDRIVVQKSTNGGVNWNNGAFAGYVPPKQQDKEWLCVDRRNNHIYMTWTQFDRYGSSATTDSTVILFSKSTDAGESWSDVLRINKKAGNCVDEDETVEGAVPCTGPNGEIYTSWSGPLGLIFDRSLDGGTTWLADDKFVTDQPGGWDYGVPGIYRANGLPVTACDVSNGPYRGNIYINWTDQRNGTLDTDVWMIKSTDGGNTWGTVKRVNDDPPGKQQFFTWMTIDQVTGHLYFVFYDRRNYTANQTDVYMAKSTDGGETFTNFKVSESPFTPSSSVFFGDYTNITAHAGIVRPIWARLNSGTMSIYTAIVDFPTGIVKINTLAPEAFKLYENYPNPFNPTTKIKIGIPSKFDKSVVKLHIYDMSGKEIRTLVDSILESGTYEVLWDATGLSSGVYICKMTAGSSGELKESLKMMLVK